MSQTSSTIFLRTPTIFSADPTPKPTIAPTVTIIPPDQPNMTTQIPISVITDSALYQGNQEREPIIRSPIGGNVLYSQGHDWTQIEPQYASSQQTVRFTESQAPYLLSPHRLHDTYRVQTPSPNYQQASPNAQMQAIFVRTTTTTHRRSTLTPRKGYTVV